MKKHFLAILALLLITVAGYGQQVRNVIFMIGDGMGLAQVQAGMMKSSVPLAIERSSFIGLQKTYSANNRVTDSAASGTALATGVKTNNGMIGVLPDSTPVRNLVEKAHGRSLSTGIVVTKSITDATPAAFTAHVPSRRMSEEIAADISRCGADVLIGGGREDFEKRKDGRNLSEEMRGEGYTVVYTLDDIKKKENGKLAAFTVDKHMEMANGGRGDFLPEATSQALTILKNNNPEGFFLMVESSRIDSGGHINDGEALVYEVIDFDKAIAIAFDFADANPGTLVIVTGDHETGGLTLPSGSEDFLSADKGVKLAFSTMGHTGVMLPVFAYGAGAENFSTIMENTDIPKKIAILMGIE